MLGALKGNILWLEPENYEKCGNIWDMKKDPARTRRWYNDMLSGNREIFVYEEEGEYLGEIALVHKNDDADYTIPGRRAYLSRMLVAKPCRGQGIGHGLMAHLAAYARSLGYSELSVGVDIDNYRARWLYETCGFTRLLRCDEDADGKYVKLLRVL